MQVLAGPLLAFGTTSNPIYVKKFKHFNVRTARTSMPLTYIAA